MLLKLTITKNDIHTSENHLTEEYEIDYGRIFRGMTAYDYAKKEGYKGSVEQFYKDMGGISEVTTAAKNATAEANKASAAATDAATSANKASAAATDAATSANTATAEAESAIRRVDSKLEEVEFQKVLTFENVNIGDDVRDIVDALSGIGSTTVKKHYLLATTDTATGIWCNAKLNFSIENKRVVLWALLRLEYGIMYRFDIVVEDGKVKEKRKVANSHVLVYDELKVGDDITEAISSYFTQRSPMYMIKGNVMVPCYLKISEEDLSHRVIAIATSEQGIEEYVIKTKIDHATSTFRVAGKETRELGALSKDVQDIVDLVEVSRGGGYVSATAEWIYIPLEDIEQDALNIHNATLKYIGEQEGYEEGITADVFEIVSSDGNIGVGQRVSIRVLSWSSSDPTKSASVVVRDEFAEWDFDSEGVVVTRTYGELYVANKRVINESDIVEKPNGNIDIAGKELMPATPSGDPMHYMYEQEGAVWNSETGFWELNTLTDITKDEMRSIYAERMVGNNPANLENWYMSSMQRTNICNFNNSSAFSLVNGFLYSAIVVAKIGRCGIYKIANLFLGCAQLQTVLDPLDFRFLTAQSNIDTASFSRCAKLQNIKIQNLKVSINFADSPLLSKESLLYMIDNCASNATFTITLHPDVYAKCQEEDEWYSEVSTALSAAQSGKTTTITLASA